MKSVRNEERREVRVWITHEFRDDLGVLTRGPTQYFVGEATREVRLSVGEIRSKRGFQVETNNKLL